MRVAHRVFFCYAVFMKNIFVENRFPISKRTLLCRAVLLIVVKFSLKPLIGLIRLGRQERVLNFSFDEEMKKNDLTNFEEICYQWLIYAKDADFLLFRRDYIKEIKEVTRYAQPPAKSIFTATVITADNKELSIEGSAENIGALRAWYDYPKYIKCEEG